MALQQRCDPEARQRNVADLSALTRSLSYLYGEEEKSYDPQVK